MKNLFLIPLLLPLPVLAADADYTLVISDHRFQPTEITIPSGKKIKLTIVNRDSTPEEFDSFALNREKVIVGQGSSTLYIGPLESGRYEFSGEFHASTAHGAINAR